MEGNNNNNTGISGNDNEDDGGEQPPPPPPIVVPPLPISNGVAAAAVGRADDDDDELNHSRRRHRSAPHPSTSSSSEHNSTSTAQDDGRNDAILPLPGGAVLLPPTMVSSSTSSSGVGRSRSAPGHHTSSYSDLAAFLSTSRALTGGTQRFTDATLGLLLRESSEERRSLEPTPEEEVVGAAAALREEAVVTEEEVVAAALAGGGGNGGAAVRRPPPPPRPPPQAAAAQAAASSAAVVVEFEDGGVVAAAVADQERARASMDEAISKAERDRRRTAFVTCAARAMDDDAAKLQPPGDDGNAAAVKWHSGPNASPPLRGATNQAPSTSKTTAAAPSLKSFGVSSPLEAHLVLLLSPPAPRTTAPADSDFDDKATNYSGYYELTPEEHGILRRERGLRLPFLPGDTVLDEDDRGDAIGTVTHVGRNGDNTENVHVVFDDGDDEPVIYTEETGVVFRQDDEDGPDGASPFPFTVESLTRRPAEEVWLMRQRSSPDPAEKDGAHVEGSKTEGKETKSNQDVGTTGANPTGVTKNDVEAKVITTGNSCCCICLEKHPTLLKGLCHKREEEPNDPTTTPPSETQPEPQSCDAAYCAECFAHHCDASIASSRYSAAPIRCPGAHCGSRLSMERWSKHASLVSLIQYVYGPRQLLTIRCPGCDMVTDLFPRLARGKEARLDVYRNAFNLFGAFLEINEGSEQETMDRLVEVWHRFSHGVLAPEECMDEFRRLLGVELMSPGDSSRRSDAQDKFADVFLGEHGLLSLVVDVERRAALTLSLVRADPFVTLPCCWSEVCFKCKVSGHHAGQTCEDRQRSEMDIDAQFCPQCGVPTIRADGCRHIVCVCGAHWQWEGEEGDY